MSTATLELLIHWLASMTNEMRNDKWKMKESAASQQEAAGPYEEFYLVLPTAAAVCESVVLVRVSRSRILAALPRNSRR